MCACPAAPVEVEFCGETERFSAANKLSGTVSPLRTITTSIAVTALVISGVAAARAEPLDCTSRWLLATDLTKCFPWMVDRPMTTAELVDELRKAYSAYIDFKQCHEARRRYVRAYVSDRGMEQAREAVRRIERAAKPRLDPEIFDSLWSRVEVTKRHRIVDSFVESARHGCMWRSDLLKVQREPPDSGRIVKDF
jgi:hypothetical protein